MELGLSSEFVKSHSVSGVEFPSVLHPSGCTPATTASFKADRAERGEGAGL